jgi:hypothetical protein
MNSVATAKPLIELQLSERHRETAVRVTNTARVSWHVSPRYFVSSTITRSKLVSATRSYRPNLPLTLYVGSLDRRDAKTCSQNTVQLMTASRAHVTDLTPGSECNPTRWG